jgi:hypothetical protein
MQMVSSVAPQDEGDSVWGWALQIKKEQDFVGQNSTSNHLYRKINCNM